MRSTHTQAMPRSILLFLLSFLLIGIASCSKENSKNGDPDKSAKTAEPTSYVVLIVAGYDSDPSPDQIAGKSSRGLGNSGMFQLKGDLETKGIDCKFFNWNGTSAGKINQKSPPGDAGIESWIRTRIKERPGTRFVSIGHSWGAHTLFDAATKIGDSESSRFPLTILLDPSSALRGGNPTKVPDCFGNVVNYHTGNLFCWGALEIENQVKNIFLGDPKNNFMKNVIPNYSSTFDIDAHNAAEWDPNIHSDMTLRILKIVDNDEQTN